MSKRKLVSTGRWNIDDRAAESRAVLPVLSVLVEDARDRLHEAPGTGPGAAELRAAEAVIRAARSDPDPHHRVARALSRLDKATGRAKR